MTASLTDQLGEPIDLASWDTAWTHEVRGYHGRWIKAGEGTSRYSMPDHSRLVLGHGAYSDPADHPFFRTHPVSAASITKTYDQTSPGERAQGARWYADAHQLAKQMTGGDAREGAILLASYSPQASWPVNMFNAARAAREHRALGPGDGLINGDMQANAQEALDGKPIDEALTSPKTRAFARLIELGGDSPTDGAGEVVIDRHALSVAVGRTLGKDEAGKAPIGSPRYHEYIADAYRQAAIDISKRDGVPMAPYQLQAITWLHQQATAQAEDAVTQATNGKARGGRALAKGRVSMTSNAWKRWMTYAQAGSLPAVPGTTSLAAQIIELLAEQSISGQIELSWIGEVRNKHGEWTRGGAEADPSTYLQFFHGTTPENARLIRDQGLHAGGYDGHDPVLTPDSGEAQVVAYERHEELKWPDKPAALISVRVPRDREDEYLHPLTSHMGYRSLRKPLPPEFIHSYKPVPYSREASLSNQIELAYNPLQPRDAHGKWIHTPGSGDWRDNPEPVTALPAEPVPGRPSKRTRRVITAAEARGNSRPVSWAEFQHLAAIGNSQLDRMKRDKAPITGLDEHWPEIKAKTYVKVQDPWGGATIDAHTGQALETDADKYALSVKPKGMNTVSVPETASETEFNAAMDRALSSFRPALERRGFHLGIFHDDDNNRIDIDPVAVVGSIAEVETLGAYTHAIGGAYHFRTGDGFWPPHVAEGPQMAGDQPVHFEGPGQWHSQADAIQDGEPDEDDALASQLTVTPDGSITRQLET